MRKALLTLIGLASSVTLVSSVSAGTWFTKKVNPGSSVYVRSAPEAFILGTLVGVSDSVSDKFTYNTDNSSGAYRFGHARGNAIKCGWVNINFFQSTTVVHTSDCTSVHYSTATQQGSRQFMLGLYARCVCDYVPNQLGGVAPFFIDAGDGTFQQTVPLGAGGYPVYGNYDYSTYAMKNPYVGTIQPGAGFFWRWVSDNSGVILGRINNGASAGNGTWGFIPRYVMPPDLRYADYYGDATHAPNLITRTDNQAGNG